MQHEEDENSTEFNIAIVVFVIFAMGITSYIAQ